MRASICNIHVRNGTKCMKELKTKKWSLIKKTLIKWLQISLHSYPNLSTIIKKLQCTASRTWQSAIIPLVSQKIKKTPSEQRVCLQVEKYFIIAIYRFVGYCISECSQYGKQNASHLLYPTQKDEEYIHFVSILDQHQIR